MATWYLEREHIKKLQSLGELEILEEPRVKPHELESRLKSADIAIVLLW